MASIRPRYVHYTATIVAIDNLPIFQRYLSYSLALSLYYLSAKDLEKEGVCVTKLYPAGIATGITKCQPTELI